MPPVTGKTVPEVIVTSAGARDHIPYQQNMTVATAVREAHKKVPFRSKLFVNNQNATNTTVLKPGDVVTIAPRARNGA